MTGGTTRADASASRPPGSSASVGASRRGPLRLAAFVLGAAIPLLPAVAGAWFETGPDEPPARARGVHVVDGSYVMNAGQLQVNITNWGLIGSRYTSFSSFADAPSGQWPAGSGVEFLWAAGLWVGAVRNGSRSVSTGQPEAEFRPLAGLESTIYEARGARLVRPPGEGVGGGQRPPSPNADDDGDGRRDEDGLDGLDNDGDGLIDEDFGQIGDQMMVCTMYDNTALSREIYPDHQPLGLRVDQESYAFASPEFEDVVVLRYTVTNVEPTTLEDVYLGFYVDADVGRRSSGTTGSDDLAGFWQGYVRTYRQDTVPVAIGYMHDGAERDAVTGYLGAAFLDRSLRGYHRFTGIQPYELGGEPTGDPDRYDLMTSTRRDDEPSVVGDHRFLITTGPIPSLPPHRSVSFHVALVAGADLQDLLTNCANAASCLEGAYFDLDGDPQTGILGRETWTCLEWWPLTVNGSLNTLLLHDANFMDTSCVPFWYQLNRITEDDLTATPSGLHCLWVNMDNCTECDRQHGEPCTRENQGIFDWNCDQTWLQPDERLHCTGVLGREGRISWYISLAAPPAPAMRLMPDHGAVHVFWDDSSEHVPDPALELVDFEGYRIWRSDGWDRPVGTSLENGPPRNSWQLVGDYDLVNDYVATDPLPEGGSRLVTMPLGRNTGLEPALYRPRCLDDPRFAGLAEAVQAVVDADTAGRYTVRPALRRTDGSPVPGLEGLLRWEGFPAALDTFFAVSERPAGPDGNPAPKRATRYYEHLDEGVHDGFLYFYSVTATDHTLETIRGRLSITGPGLAGSPGTTLGHVTPGPQARTATEWRQRGGDVYVYPNPATRESLAEFQPMAPDQDDPTGVRVVFNNLPRAHNRVRVFTLDGDLVVELEHDGTDGAGSLPWNLVSRSGQQVVSGIYLFEVESRDPDFEPFVGKFVVVR